MIVGTEKPSLEELAHYGVKGMKWGVHKSEPTHSSYSARKQANDQQTYGKRGVKRINHRLNEGLTREQAHHKEDVRDAYQRLTLIGATVAASILLDSGSISSARLFVANRADANRKAEAVTKITSTAEKLKYVKPRGGVHNITTAK